MRKYVDIIVGFLLIGSTHWLTIILTAILNNLVGVFIEYEHVPWFRVFMVLFEVVVIIKLLDHRILFDIDKKKIMLLAFTSAGLLVLSQFSYLIDYHPAWCGNALVDGTLKETFGIREESEFYAELAENIILSLGIVLYTMNKLKTDPSGD